LLGRSATRRRPTIGYGGPLIVLVRCRSHLQSSQRDVASTYAVFDIRTICYRPVIWSDVHRTASTCRIPAADATAVQPLRAGAERAGDLGPGGGGQRRLPFGAPLPDGAGNHLRCAIVSSCWISYAAGGNGRPHGNRDVPLDISAALVCFPEAASCAGKSEYTTRMAPARAPPSICPAGTRATPMR
jgi:hypothetical protein